MEKREIICNIWNKVRYKLAALGIMLVLLLTVHPLQIDAATPVEGIDVSKWQGDINWVEVKNAGIQFAMIGTGQYKNGVISKDPKFETNIKGAVNSGIHVGIYHYLTATTAADAKDAADYVLDLIDGYPISYPIAVDFEDSMYAGYTKTQRTDIVLAFLQTIADAGYYPVIYASDSYFANYLDMTRLSGYDCWVASWYGTPSSVKASMWQYSSTGSINGISTTVDLDYSYKDYAAIIPTRTKAVSRRQRFKAEWKNDGKNYWYIQTDGTTAKNTFLTVNGLTYYVNSKGYRVSGWQQINGKYYYFRKSSGTMKTGWLTLKGKKYYLDPETGVRTTGWLTVDGKKYYMNSSTGVMATGWKKINGKYYYFRKSSGTMKTGWLTLKGKKYYLDPATGIRTTGWLTIGSKTYYFSKSQGVMATGWKKIRGKYYYFRKSNGVMLKNRKVGKYILGADGVCTNRK